ncbi:MAG: hypothetical protein U0165_01915 [Polyangiaceae bacterium]
MPNQNASHDAPEDSHPYRGAPQRPRLWVPGVLAVDPPPASNPSSNEWRINISKLAGLWDGEEDVTQWKDITQFVALVDLDLEIAHAADIVHPATLPLDLRPHVRSLVARAPLLEIDAGQTHRLGVETHTRRANVAAPRCYSVGFTRHADDFFTFSAWRAYSASRGDLDPIVTTHVSGSRWNLESSVWSNLSNEEKRALGVDEITSEPIANDSPPDDIFDDLIERILDAASDGMVTSESISLGRWLRQVCADYANPDTRADAERMLDEREAEMAEIAERANSHAHEAIAIRQAVQNAGTALLLHVPVYGEIRAERRARLTLQGLTRRASQSDALEVCVHRASGEAVLSESLDIPEKTVWLARDVEPWEPPLRVARIARQQEEFRQRWQASRKGSSRAAWFAAFVALTALTWALIHAVR